MDPDTCTRITDRRAAGGSTNAHEDHLAQHGTTHDPAHGADRAGGPGPLGRRRGLQHGGGGPTRSRRPHRERIPRLGASDGGGSADGTAAPAPGSDVAGWAAEEDLALVPLDLKAADRGVGLLPGQLEREDRFGTWLSPGFAEDSPVLTDEPVAIDATAEELFGGHEATVGAATGVLVQSILEILDTPLLLEEDNSRSSEVSAALVERLGLSEAFLPTFDDLFADVPVSGAFSPGEGLPETCGFEPREYPADGPRMHLLQAATAVELLELPELTGPLVLASSQGALPITAEDGRETLVRTAIFGLGLDAETGSALMVYVVSAAPAVHLEDSAALPAVEGAEVTGDWQEHAVRDLTVSLPADLGEPAATEVGLVFRDGERRGSVMRHLLAVPSPYPLTSARHVARAEVPGAELAVAAVGPGMDGLITVSVTLHRGEETFSVQLHDVTDEEAPRLAHGLLAGLRLAE